METNQPSQRRRCLSFKLYFGSILILLGLLMMARNGNYINEDLYSALISWPMIPILLGFYTLLHRNFTSGLIFIAVGLYFLMPYFTWIGPNAVFWPYFLIGGGIAFIFIPRNKRHKEWKHHHCSSSNNNYTSKDGYINSESVFGSVQQIVMDETFKGATIKNNFGGTVLDLRRTTLIEKETYIELNCNFGGIEIYIPSSWNVRMEVNPFLGGCEDSRIPSLNIDLEHTLIIRGNVSFGGIEIKS